MENVDGVVKALPRGDPVREDDMSRGDEPLSEVAEPAELQRYFGNECGDDDYGGGGGDNCYDDYKDDGYDCRGLMARGAQAFRGNFRPPRMPFRGRPFRPFRLRGDCGYGRGPPFRGRGPRFGPGRPPFGPPARGGWPMSPRFNRGGPSPPRRPFFRGRPPQLGRPPRFTRMRVGSDRGRGFRRGFGVRPPYHNGGDLVRYCDRRDDVGSGPDCSPEPPQRESPQRRPRSRSVAPSPREEDWRAQRSQGARDNHCRGDARESRSCSMSDASDSEGRGRKRCSRDTQRATTSRIRSRNVAAEVTQRIATRVAIETRLRERTCDTGAATRSASRTRTEAAQAQRMQENDRWMKREDALPASCAHHAQAKTVSIKPTVRKVKASVEPAVDSTKVRAHGATDTRQQSAAGRRTECIKDVCKRRVATKRHALDKCVPKDKNKAARNVDLVQIADRSCLSPSNEDASGDAEVRKDPQPATSTLGPDSVDDGQQFRRCTPEINSSRTLLASSDSATNIWSEQAVGENMPCQIMSTSDLTVTTHAGMTVQELREGTESSEEVEFPEIGVYEEIVEAQDDDVASEGLQETSGTAAFVASAGTLNCESDLDIESESSRTDDEDEDAPLVDGDQAEDATEVISTSLLTSAKNAVERWTDANHAYSTASVPLVVSGAGAAASLWPHLRVQPADEQDDDCNAPGEPPQGNWLAEQANASVSSQGTDPGVRDACSDTYVDCGEDTVSFASTVTDSDTDDVTQSSDSSSAATVARPSLEAPGPSTTASGPRSSAAQQHKTSPRQPCPPDAGATCDAFASTTECTLFELNAFAAMAVHDILEDEAAKKKTLALYATGRRTNTRKACACEMKKLLLTAANSARARRDNLTSALRRLAHFQSTLQHLSPDASPTEQERDELADDTDS